MTRDDLTRDDLVTAIAEEAQGCAKPLEFAERVADRLRLETEPLSPPRPEVKAYDLLAEQDYLYPRGALKTRLVRGRPVKRDPSTITHIVVHQTAVEYGVSDRQLAASGGDRELALARRFLDVGCHVAACRSGFIVLAHPLEDLVLHGNGFNEFSLGIEIDGRYAGLEDDPSTVAREDLRTTWRGDPTELTPRTTRAACAGIDHLVTEGRKLGMPVTHIVAHRQSNPKRRSDPGEAIWKRVVLGYAVKELGLRVDSELVLTSMRRGRPRRGRPIPVEWDPSCTGKY